ncbi:MAG TPA: acetyl ornithine aminotransferase family protein [Candidatus Bathyarchaeia archaeon]|nr:acetyl ornithine aminotransferase family protein [Candidatus Bathyarchaeia archaeon]
MTAGVPLPKIIVTPPGPKARELLKKDADVISSSIIRCYPLVAESGSGCIVKDVDGNEFIDFNSGLIVLAVGHSHPRVVKAIKEQAEKLIHYSWTDFYYKPIIDYGTRLIEITPGSYQKRVFFSNSGAEANEAAMKVARWHTRKPLFLAYTGSFHGRSFGTMSLSGSKPVQRRHFFPLVSEVTHVPYPYCYRCPFGLKYPDCNMWCVDFIEEEVLKKFHPPEDTAAMFIEPIQGEGGYIVPPEDYFQRLKKILDKYNILMVDDEIQTGMGRTGKWLAIEHWGITPDIITLSKSLASGVPIGATISRAEIMDWESGSHANTLGGNPIACAAGLQVIEIIKEEKLLENATKQGTYLAKRLKEMQHEYTIIGDVRGRGLMVGAELIKDQETKEPASEEVTTIINKCFRRGLAIISAGKSTIRFAPPLIITRDLIDAGLDVFEGAVKEVSNELK